MKDFIEGVLSIGCLISAGAALLCALQADWPATQALSLLVIALGMLLKA